MSMQEPEELDRALSALTISEASDAASMETEACEPLDPDPEPPSEEADFSWMLVTQFRSLRLEDDLNLSTRALASSSVHSEDVTMESCLFDETDVSSLGKKPGDEQNVDISGCSLAHSKKPVGDEQNTDISGMKTEETDISGSSQGHGKKFEGHEDYLEISVKLSDLEKQRITSDASVSVRPMSHSMKAEKTCSAEPKLNEITTVSLNADTEKDGGNSKAGVDEHEALTLLKKSACVSPQSGGSSLSSPTNSTASAYRVRKRVLDSNSTSSHKRSCPQSEGFVRVSLRVPGPWLQATDMAALLVPFSFPHEPRVLYMDSSFASGPGWEGPGRPRHLVVNLVRRKDFLEFYEGRSPRVWATLPYYLNEVNSLESWRLRLESLDDVPKGFLARRLFQLPPEPKQHFEGALRWANTFARTAHGLLRHLHRCARVPRPRGRLEDFVVELRMENRPDDHVVVHALRSLIHGLSPCSGLIFRSRGDGPGWTNLHVEVCGDLREALVLIAATNCRSMVLVRDTETYVLVPGGLARVQSYLVPPSFIRSRFSRALHRLGPKKARPGILRSLLRHLVATKPSNLLPSCCMDLVMRLGVCSDDAYLLGRILLCACRSARDYPSEMTKGFVSGFKLDASSIMCCLDDAGLIEFAAQFIYCPCSSCTPFLFERGQIEAPSLSDLL